MEYKFIICQFAKDVIEFLNGNGISKERSYQLLLTVEVWNTSFFINKTTKQHEKINHNLTAFNFCFKLQ